MSCRSFARCLAAITCCLALVEATAYAEGTDGHGDDHPDPWRRLQVPGTWEDNAPSDLANLDGFAWYRARVRIPSTWTGEIHLRVRGVDNAHEAFWDGVRLGSAGAFPPDFRNGLDEERNYPVSRELRAPGKAHTIALRVFDEGGRGGFKEDAPAVFHEGAAIVLAGAWEFRRGDDISWAKEETSSATPAFADVVRATSLASGEPGDGPRTALEELWTFTTPADLEVSLALAEPAITQPVHVSFDERGRLWVVEYAQYPEPAGLRMLSRDNYWRAVYDKVPAPPPRHYPGRDRVSIHEDRDGDGHFETRKAFAEGLNIVTAVARGRGGVWMLNPPYLLFWPDADLDDVPDADPEIVLSGFGLEDTHSVVNSLTWGPDGWLYGAQGSTVSAAIVRPGRDDEPVRSMGQLVWRYHPETHRYEVFAEGGGNAFGIEIDSKGRVFSGHNGGDTRGFHYPQGGYLQKGFSKHGPLSNPYAFGYFPPIPHHPVPRFTHCFVIYEGGALPDEYSGKLFGVAPLLRHVVLSEVNPDGATVRTRDIGYGLESSDPWFRPVDIEIGPDGALWIADWYDRQVNHYRNHEGEIDRSNGRVWRLGAKGSTPLAAFDLSWLSSGELVGLLSHENRWFRETARRMLGDRKDRSVLPTLVSTLREEKGQLALEALWAIHVIGGRNDEVTLSALYHENADVRRWAVRLEGDDRETSGQILEELVALAAKDPAPIVHSQLASTARRLPARDTLAIVTELLRRDEDAGDRYIPLLIWWAIEAKIDEDTPLVLGLFHDPKLWSRPLVDEFILERLMRRFAQRGTRRDLANCAALFELSPDVKGTAALLRGFEAAFQGRPVPELPPELVRALAKAGGATLALRVRLGEEEAIAEALGRVAEKNAPIDERVRLARVLSQAREKSAAQVLVQFARGESDDASRAAVLSALEPFDDPAIPPAIIDIYAELGPAARESAALLLASRGSSARALLLAIDAGRIDPTSIPSSAVRNLARYEEADLRELVHRHFGDSLDTDVALLEREIDRLTGVIDAENGSPYAGKKIFRATCARCHRLFDEGGAVGPDLTPHPRSDVRSLLLAIVHPSAEIREGFETSVVVTRDGRTLSGFVADQDDRALVLRSAGGQDVVIPQSDVLALEPSPNSLMPEGLLAGMADQDIRDLFAYLRSAQPLND